MTIGPAPMIRMVRMSSRRGMQDSRGQDEEAWVRSQAPLIDQVDKALEEVMAVLWAGRSLRMVLHREHRLAFDPQPFIRIVEQRDMRGSHADRQSGGIDHETVILAGDFHFTGFQILDRMIGAAMPVM